MHIKETFKCLVSHHAQGRYLFLNALANQLRYPNSHTHYFSCVLLFLFAEAQQEIIQVNDDTLLSALSSDGLQLAASSAARSCIL